MTPRSMTLEDGEIVTPLRRGSRPKPRWKSDAPHAGHWGAGSDYLLIPNLTRFSVARRARQALNLHPDLSNRSGDSDLLLLGPPHSIHALFTLGPSWARALTRPSLTPEQRDRIVAAGAPFRFKPPRA